MSKYYIPTSQLSKKEVEIRRKKVRDYYRKDIEKSRKRANKWRANNREKLRQYYIDYYKRPYVKRKIKQQKIDNQKLRLTNDKDVEKYKKQHPILYNKMLKKLEKKLYN